MNKDTPLPPEFQPLQGKVSYIRKISENEWSSSCLYCGGEQHQYGEYPDRFRLWRKSRVTGGPCAWCRRCGKVWTPGNSKLDTGTHARLQEERKVYEEEKRTQQELAIEVLRKDKAWIRYNELLNGTYREYYYMRGITDFFIDYWMLGYNPEKSIWDGEKFYNSPALTIPIFKPCEEEPYTIRNRLLAPIDPGDKYRPEFKNLPSGVFIAERDTMPHGKAILIEGELKAMTTYITLDSLDYYVVGTPGKRPSHELFGILDNCEVVYLILDPDAFEKDTKTGVTAVRRMVDFFKDRARVIRLPGKIDDLILAGHLSQASLVSLIKSARRIK